MNPSADAENTEPNLHREPDSQPSAGTVGIRLGRIAGATVVLTHSSVLLVALVTLAYLNFVQASTGFSLLMSLGVSLAIAVLLLVSIFMHELAHALAARTFGYHPHEVVLDMWGGHTTYSAEQISPVRQAVISAAGPVANLTIAAVAGVALRAAHSGTVTAVVVYAVVFMNLALGLFNALPGLPLDGGQVAASLVWRITGRREWGLRVAGWAGRVVAIVLSVWALQPLTHGGQVSWSTGWTLLISWILWRGASDAIRLSDASVAPPVSR